MLIIPSASGCAWGGFIQDSKAYFESATAEDVVGCISAGASPLEPDYWGFTPLHWAAGFSRDLATLPVLIDAGANPNAGNRANVTPLHFAAQHNWNPKFIEALIEAGADVNSRSASDHTPLHLASRHNPNASVLRVLLDAGADPMVRDLPFGSTPLHSAAAFSESTSVISLLLRAGADPNAQDGFRQASPVHWAARRNSNPSMLKALLDGGADPDIEDSSGMSPLNWAVCHNENPEIAISLLEASDQLSTRSRPDVNWIVVTILEAEQFHCDPNPQVVMFDTHLCANTTKEMTVEYRIEGRLVEVTLHGQGTAASRRDRSMLMQHAETVLESFAAAGFSPVDTN